MLVVRTWTAGIARANRSITEGANELTHNSDAEEGLDEVCWDGILLLLTTRRRCHGSSGLRRPSSPARPRTGAPGGGGGRGRAFDFAALAAVGGIVWLTRIRSLTLPQRPR